MSSQISYLDAFDEVVIEDYSSNEDESFDLEIEDDIISLDSSDLKIEDDIISIDSSDLEIEEEEEGEYEVTFISDDEDDDNDFEAVKELPKESKESQLKQLNEKYKDDLEKCNQVLEGKLNWVSAPISHVNDSLDKDEYPDINAKPKKEKKFGLKPIQKKTQKPMDIDIHVKNFFPSQINIRAPAKQLPLKKNWFCKNLIQTGTCRFGDKCIFAHTLTEVEANTEQCKFGQRCNNVKIIAPNQYINSGKYKCIRRHPNENINSFVKRVQ